MNINKMTWLIVAMMVAMATLTGDAFAYDKVYVFQRISVDAGESISIGEVVAIKDTDGEAYKADADDSSLRPPIGVAGTAGTDGNSMEVVISGVFSGWTGLSEGGYAYLSAATAGEITQSAPGSGNNYQVGVAISSTQYLIDCDIVQASSATFSNPVSGASPLEFEGASADAYETTLSIEDPTADNTITLPNDGGYIIVLENQPTEDQNLIFEGASADAYETTIAITDPTADNTVTVPNTGGYLRVFDNAGTDDVSLVFEGASADAYETTITVTDPTADNTVTIPDGSGTVDVCENIVKASTATLTAAEVKNTVINNYGQSSESTLTLPTAAVGMHFTYILGTAGQTSHIKADTSDKIVLDGSALDDADKVSNNGASSVVGEQLDCWSFQSGASAYDWSCISTGTWTDGGA
jgi:hypothetical protein